MKVCYVCHHSACLFYILYLYERGSLGRGSHKTELQFVKHILQQENKLSRAQQNFLTHLRNGNNVRLRCMVDTLQHAWMHWLLILPWCGALSPVTSVTASHTAKRWAPRCPAPWKMVCRPSNWHLAGSPFLSPFLAVPSVQRGKWLLFLAHLVALKRFNSEIDVYLLTLFCFSRLHRLSAAFWGTLTRGLPLLSCTIWGAHVELHVLHVKNSISKWSTQHKVRYTFVDVATFLCLIQRTSGTKWNFIWAFSIKVGNRWNIARCCWETNKENVI